MSYLEYFKFARQPFSEHASREALWNDTRMEEGLSRLNHLLGNGLVGLVTGAIGLGKSALVRRFIQECSPQVCDPQYCHLAQLPANRVSVRYQLKPLSKDQTRKYIDYSVGSSGGDMKLFDDGVKDLIHEFTGGNLSTHDSLERF